MSTRWRALVGATLASLAAAALGSAPAYAQEDANSAKRVRIQFPRDDGTLTPYTFELGYPLMTLVYDTLLWRRQQRDRAPGPWLARRQRRLDAGKRVELRLREGAKWHDGRRVTPADVAFTFEYFKSRYHPRFTPQLDAVEGAEVKDRLTVAINLRHPSPNFDQVLADVPILPRHLWQGLSSGQVPEGLPVGSGPYELVERDPKQGYRFKAREDYYLGEPKVDTIEVPFIADFGRAVRALRGRDLDVIPVNLPQREEREIRSSAFKIERGTFYAGTVLMFNTRRPPFDSARARRAISRALDVSRIARATVGADPLSFQADRGYPHPRSTFAATGILHDFDEARARAELEALDLPPIRVLAPNNDPVRSEAGRQVALALRRAGAAATVKEVTAGRLAAAVGEDGSEPNFEAAIWNTPPLASYNPDFLRAVFGSDERLSPLNYSGYRSAEFDEKAERAARETNPDERDALIRDQLRLIEGDAPVVPLFYPKGAFVYRASVYDGWVYVDGTGILDKRSFLPSGPAETEGAGGSPFSATEGSGGGIGTLGFVALGVVGIVLVFIASGVVTRRRGG